MNLELLARFVRYVAIAALLAALLDPVLGSGQPWGDAELVMVAVLAIALLVSSHLAGNRQDATRR